MHRLDRGRCIRPGSGTSYPVDGRRRNGTHALPRPELPTSRPDVSKGSEGIMDEHAEGPDQGSLQKLIPYWAKAHGRLIKILEHALQTPPGENGTTPACISLPLEDAAAILQSATFAQRLVAALL